METAMQQQKSASLCSSSSDILFHGLIVSHRNAVLSLLCCVSCCDEWPDGLSVLNRLIYCSFPPAAVGYVINCLFGQ